MTFICNSVDVALMGSGSKAHFSQDAIDVAFPEGAGFGMALESMAKRKDQGTVKLDTVSFRIQFSIDAVDQDIDRNNNGGGGVSVGVTDISSKDQHVGRSREGT